MVQSTQRTASTAVCAVLVSALTLVAASTSVLANTVTPPVSDGPGGRSSGGARDANCLRQNSITALIPTSEVRGLTTEKYPTLYFYLPETSAKTAEFVLQNSAKQRIYKTTVPLSQKPGVVSLRVPTTVASAALETGQDYRWFFSVVCDANAPDKSGNPFVMGWIKRAEPSPALARQLAQSTPRDRATLYKQAGFWYEAVNTLAQLRQSAPKDAALAADWSRLLQSAGLGQLATEPLVQISQRPNR